MAQHCLLRSKYTHPCVVSNRRFVEVHRACLVVVAKGGKPRPRWGCAYKQPADSERKLLHRFRWERQQQLCRKPCAGNLTSLSHPTPPSPVLVRNLPHCMCAGLQKSSTGENGMRLANTHLLYSCHCTYTCVTPIFLKQVNDKCKKPKPLCESGGGKSSVKRMRSSDSRCVLYKPLCEVVLQWLSFREQEGWRHCWAQISDFTTLCNPVPKMAIESK